MDQIYIGNSKQKNEQEFILFTSKNEAYLIIPLKNNKCNK